MGAIISLAHDSMVIISLYSIFWGILPFSLEIDQAAIAVILTVIGYSINDTVIIFDRIREYKGLHKKMETGQLMNIAINHTLSRTINTSSTVIVVLLAMFIFGGEIIRGFNFALMIGVITGTYSSIFIASAITYDTELYLNKRNAAKEGIDLTKKEAVKA
jgi:SecD/SecF fusion protein